MLTLPDVKAKQLAIIQTERGALNILQLKNDNLLYRRDGKVVSQCSLHRVFCVVVIGDLAITTTLIRKINEFGVNILLLRTNMQAYALFGARSEGNYLLRQQQYTLSDERSLAIAKHIVTNKISNQIVLLKSINQSYEPLQQILQKVATAQNRETLLGYEGTASKYFFARYFADLNWKSRLPRAKPDVPNFLLDIGYTVAFNFSDVFLRLFGFDSYQGIYHQLFFARKSLACDVVEPFRCLVERRLRTALNLGIIKQADFKQGRYGVRCNPEQSAQYVALFAQVVMDEREEFYAYVRALHRHIMDERNPLPEFRLKRLNMIICTYDISDTKLRTHFAKQLQKYGRRLQMSVFELNNSPRVLNNVVMDIDRYFKPRFKQTDSVLIFQICKTDAPKIKRYGWAVNEESDMLIFK